MGIAYGGGRREDTRLLSGIHCHDILVSPEGVSSTKLNNDGNPDVIVAHGNDTETGGTSILPGDGNGGLQSPVTYFAGGVPGMVAVAGFNSDGNQDSAAGGFPVIFIGGVGAHL